MCNKKFHTSWPADKASFLSEVFFIGPSYHLQKKKKKTSLLLSLMNEIHVKADCHAINGRLSYAAQEPWILNTSIRENILFGKPYDEERYKQVLHVTTLERDVKIWHHGDNTLAGERGVALSGGQRARVSLARAIYHEADIYLLDDPLSAVDARVAKQIFTKCIKNFLSSKTIILVTHQLHFLSSSSKILILDQGKCEIFDSLDAIFKSVTNVGSILRLRKSISDNSEIPRLRPEKTRKPSLADSLRRKSLFVQDSPRRMSSYSTGGMSIVSKISSLPEGDFIDVTNEPEVVEEKQKSGSFGGKTYWTYFRAGSGVFSAFFAFLVNIISQILFSANDMRLANWTNRLSALHTLPKDPLVNVGKNDTFLEFKSRTTLLRGALFFQMTYRASITSHDTIFKKILRSPMQMFEENPVGKIFSRDLGVLDETFPFCAFDVLLNILICLSVLIIVSTVSWYMMIPAAIIIVLVIIVRNCCIPVARDVKQIECITRSPVYSHVADTVDGLVTIRTFGMEKDFQQRFVEKLDDHTAAWNILLSISRALGTWIEWITCSYIFITTFLIHLMSDFLPAASAGLVLSQLLLMINVIQWTVRESANAEAHMTSVERVLEYTKLETENDLVDCECPLKQWPDKGAIKFEAVSMKYPTAPKPSLIDVSISIGAGEKIGVVGRTGAGKSSLLTCLFRLVEPEGVIEIDGIDIKNIPLENLRSKISIIPQDPVLFSGTIRFNLDPFDEHKDVALWETLDDVQLKEAVADLTGDLEHEIREGGDNFSVGQRQLICLARALLRNNKILVIDEGTANVDHKTDHLIQQTIRTKFAGCTVLTIAHRLDTIIDSDRILVLEAGQVVEFDEAYALLENDESMFTKLVSKTGPSMSRELIASAKQAFEGEHNKSNEYFIENSKE
ncbi:ATP-binding cassette sub-family C member 4-like [Brevipalpus obovatus]|uniref:ATP-binding cassette sub-family C member 4-like n=1 Tax=Brevipalpus obovatus TaxID=246614 RepID=UPI003D9DF498